MDQRSDRPLVDDRHETPTERLDRNWGEILQELRVTQTGIQILTGFLLTVPFQQRFTDLSAVVVFACTQTLLPLRSSAESILRAAGSMKPWPS